MPPKASPAETSELSRLEKSFVFYGSYHADAINQWVHIIFVPTILLTFFSLFSYFPLGQYVSPSVATAISTYTFAPFSASTVILAVYVVFYLWLSPPPSSVLGLLAVVMACGLFYLGGLLYDGGKNLAIAGGLNVVSWIAQFYAHAVHEKRSPALLDNLSQALLMAPFFVFLELLFNLGLLKDLQQKVQPHIDEAIKAFKEKK